jgi:hypothetical protein
MRRVVIAVLLSARIAAANGRPAETSSIHFGPNDAIAAGTTFGLVVSHDGGATWQWSCEDALGYGGEYDPAFAYTANGTLFSSSFSGLRRSSDNCTVAASTPLGAKNATAITRGPDNALYVALSEPANTATMEPGDVSIYKSIDDGATFPISATPSPLGTWWYSVEVAPSDAMRVYATGFRVELGDRVLKLYRSSDGGASYQPMSTNGLVTSPSSAVLIAGVSAQNPDVLFARVTYQDNAPNNEAIYRSIDAGANWTKVFAKTTSLTALVRANGDVVVANRYAEAWVSHDGGDAWEPLAGAPHINCLVENSAHEVWACTQNYAPSDETRDDAGIMRSTDLATWTPVLKYQNIAGPIACAPGTPQQDTCVAMRWCTMRHQFAIAADPTECASLVDGVTSDDATPKPSGGGCCDASSEPSIAGLWLLALVIWRRDRNRSRRA